MAFKIIILALMALCLPAAVQAANLPDPYPALLAEAEEIDRMDAVMPLNIFNLAARLAEAPNPELTAKLVDTRLSRATGKWGFGRRVGYTTLRFMGKRDYASIDLPALIMRGLDDPMEWVRYDAVWLADIVELDTPAFRAKLKEMAAGLIPAEHDAVSSSDAVKQRQRRAGKLLQKLEAK